MHVLIIDNTTLFHKILGEIFSRTGSDLTPLFCENATQGMEYLANEEVGFICISMYLEDTNGIELARQIRQTDIHTPIILYTSEESHEVYTQALSVGVTEVFHKKDVQHLVNFINRFTLQQRHIEGRVLYVEDSLSQRQMNTSFFTDKGLEVTSFGTAEEAFEAYKKADFDLIVTDIVLEGGVTGMELTRWIRRLEGEKGDVPILALTGFDDISRRIELFYLGVNDYVIKPVIQEELLARVRSLINGRRFYMDSVKLRKRAEAADQAKSTFISQMSHELRTPLNAILGFGQILELDAADFKPEQQSNIREIINAGEHLLQLINDLLDMAKIESGRLNLSIQAVDVAELVQQCIGLISAQSHARNLQIHNHIEAQNFQVKADSIRLKQVFLNLLSNATKYNRSNGLIDISAVLKADNILRLSVRDTGKGLTEEEIDQLFIPFERLNAQNEVEGAGIGLVISQHLIEMMGGKIGVESVPAEGSTFWIELQLA